MQRHVKAVHLNDGKKNYVEKPKKKCDKCEFRSSNPMRHKNHFEKYHRKVVIKEIPPFITGLHNEDFQGDSIQSKANHGQEQNVDMTQKVFEDYKTKCEFCDFKSIWPQNVLHHKANVHQ